MEFKKGRLTKELEDIFYLIDSKLIELYKKVYHQKKHIIIFQKERKCSNIIIKNQINLIENLT